MNAGFCASCGARLPAPAVPTGHAACPACGWIAYRNPEVHAACIVPESAGRPGLRSAPLLRGETIQDAAMRATGGTGTRLALYCALTDLAGEAVYLVFRADDAACTPPCGHPPAWSAALLARFALDREAGVWPVYTGRYRDGELELAVVPAEEGVLRPGPA